MRCTVAMLFLALAMTACHSNARAPSEPPTRSTVTSVEAIGPVPLSAGTIDRFLRWASRAGAHESVRVRDAIVSARGDGTVLAPLLERLQKAGGRDLGTSLVILSIVGELQNPAAVGPLGDLSGTRSRQPERWATVR